MAISISIILALQICLAGNLLAQRVNPNISLDSQCRSIEPLKNMELNWVWADRPTCDKSITGYCSGKEFIAQAPFSLECAQYSPHDHSTCVAWEKRYQFTSYEHAV